MGTTWGNPTLLRKFGLRSWIKLWNYDVSTKSISVEKVYKDNWETALDCSDYVLFLGSRSKETLEYMSSMLGKKVGIKSLLVVHIQNKVHHLITGI